MIYIDSPVCAWHVTQSKLKDTDNYSVAIFHIPFPFDDNFSEKINNAINEFQHVVILCSELHRVTVDFILENQHPKITYFVCGFVSDVKVYQWMDWLHTSLEFYQSRPELLAQLNPYETKPLLFDILLGCTRRHRDIVYDYIKQYQLESMCIMSYYRYAHKPLANNNNFIFEDNIKIDNSVTHTVGLVEYHGENVNLSKIIPISIYNQTAYSIVTETNAENDFTFYTEKIVKPMLSKRLFIVIAGYNYLKNLRSLGFKTFDGIINEGYDDIKDNDSRYIAACEQIKVLSQLPQEEVLAKIKPIVEHNYNILTSTDWVEQMHTNLRSTIDATYILQQSSSVQF